jgi:hypothetical protein
VRRGLKEAQRKGTAIGKYTFSPAQVISIEKYTLKVATDTAPELSWNVVYSAWRLVRIRTIRADGADRRRPLIRSLPG